MTDGQGSPLLFISHASSPGGDEMLDNLAQIAFNEGYQVYLDKDYGPSIAGDKYREPMLTALEECKVALIVLTPEALDSEWVKFETIRLLHRRDQADDVLVLPIFAQGASPKKLANTGWVPTNLAEVQGLSYAADDFAVQLSTQLRQQASAWKNRQKFGRIGIGLTAELRKVDSETLAAALDVFSLSSHGSQQGRARRLADALLLSSDLDLVAAAVRRVAASSAEVGANILDMVLPYAWLTDEHASWFRTIIKTKNNKRSAAATEHKSIHTCIMVIRRACQSHPPEMIWISATAQIADRPGERLVETVRIALREQYQDPDLTDDDMQRLMDEHDVILVLPPMIPDGEVLEPIQRIFPRLSLFLRNATLRELHARGLSFVSSITPPVKPTTVERVLDLRGHLIASFSPRKGIG